MNNTERFFIVLLGGLAMGFLFAAIFSEVLGQARAIKSAIPLIAGSLVPLPQTGLPPGNPGFVIKSFSKTSGIDSDGYTVKV